MRVASLTRSIELRDDHRAEIDARRNPGRRKSFYWSMTMLVTLTGFGCTRNIYHDELDCTPPNVKGSSYPEEDALPQEKQKQCDRCRSFLKRGALSCSVCGHQCVADTTVVIKGELAELTHTETKEPKRKKRELRAKSKRSTPADRFAQRRGWSEGWAAHKFKERFGVWPAIGEVPMTPRKAVMDFIAESAKKYRANEKRKGTYILDFRKELRYL